MATVSLTPGFTTLTKSQALSLAAVSSGATAALNVGMINLRWVSGTNANHIGKLKGFDIDFNVVKVADYTVTNDTEFDTALTALATSGGVIAMSPSGVFAAGRTFTQKPSAPLTIRSTSTAFRAKLPTVTVGNQAANLRFQYIDFGDNSTTGDCVTSGSQNSNDIIFYQCEFYGAPYDANGDWHLNAPTSRRGITDQGGGRFNRLKIIDCYFHHLENACKMIWAGACEVTGNTVDVYYDDAFALGWDYLSPASGSRFNWNFITRCAGLLSDRWGNTDYTQYPEGSMLGPHNDAFQIYEYHTLAAGVGMKDIEIIGNIVFDGDARGSTQFNLSRSTGTFTSRFKVAHNIHIVNTIDEHFPYYDNAYGHYIFNNIGVWRDPGNTLGGPAQNSTSANVTNEAGYPKSFIAAHMSKAIVTTGPVELGSGAVPNVSLLDTQVNALANFDGPFPISKTATKAEIIAACKHKVGSTLANLRGIVDYDARTINYALEPSWLGADNFLSQTTGATVTVGWRKLQGGGPNQTITITGGEYRIADDAAGTNATNWTTAEGVVQEGQYIDRRAVNSALAATSVTCTVTINGWTNSFSTTTA